MSDLPNRSGDFQRYATNETAVVDANRQGAEPAVLPPQMGVITKKIMPTKMGEKSTNFSGQKKREKAAKSVELPTKKEAATFTIKERRKTGWIEYPKHGTKNPKRYARKRRWVKVNGSWVKSKPKRMKGIRPLSEEKYEQLKNYNSRTSVRKTKEFA